MSVNGVNTNLYLPDQSVRQPKKALDKDAFLQIMMEQLKNQDPSSSMDSDKFISEMAQFTSLEQMTNLNDQFTQMFQLQQLTQGSALIGKNVTLANGEETISGVVEKLQMSGNTAKVVVDGTSYDLSQITTVTDLTNTANG